MASRPINPIPGRNAARRLRRDRFSFMRFLGLSLGDRVPDATTIWLFRERLVKAGAIKRLFDRFDQAVRDAGYIAMAGQIVDASLVAAAKQRNTEDEKADIKAGLSPRHGKRSRRSCGRRIAMPAGPSSSARPSRKRMAKSKSTSRSRASATRTMSRSTAPTV